MPEDVRELGRRVPRGVGFDERELHHQPARPGEGELDERDTRGPRRFSMHESQPLRFESHLSCGGGQLEKGVSGVHHARATSPSERFGGRSNERHEVPPSGLEATRGTATVGATIALGRDVRRICNDQACRVQDLGSDRRQRSVQVPDAHATAALVAIGLQVVLAEGDERGLALDEVDPLGSGEVKEGEAHRAHTGSEVDGEAYAATLRREGPEQDGVHIGAVTRPSARLKEPDAAAEEGIFADRRIGHGRAFI